MGTKQLQYVFWPVVAVVAASLVMILVVGIRGEGPRPEVNPANIVVPATGP